MSIDFKLKYLKYKKKYINLQKGGSNYTEMVRDIKQKQDSQLFNFYNLDNKAPMMLQCKHEYNVLKSKYMLLQEINRTLNKIYFNIVRNPNL